MAMVPLPPQGDKKAAKRHERYLKTMAWLSVITYLLLAIMLILIIEKLSKS